MHGFLQSDINAWRPLRCRPTWIHNHSLVSLTRASHQSSFIAEHCQNTINWTTSQFEDDICWANRGGWVERLGLCNLCTSAPIHNSHSPPEWTSISRTSPRQCPITSYTTSPPTPIPQLHFTLLSLVPRKMVAMLNLEAWLILTKVTGCGFARDAPTYACSIGKWATVLGSSVTLGIPASCGNYKQAISEWYPHCREHRWFVAST